MAFKLNQQVIWLDANTATREREIKQGTITQIRKDVVWINRQHKPENCFYAAFFYPDNEECRELLEDMIAMKARHEAEESAMLARQIQMTHKCAREGTK
jgi:DNA relaxase NicK